MSWAWIGGAPSFSSKSPRMRERRRKAFFLKQFDIVCAEPCEWTSLYFLSPDSPTLEIFLPIFLWWIDLLCFLLSLFLPSLYIVAMALLPNSGSTLPNFHRHSNNKQQFESNNLKQANPTIWSDSNQISSKSTFQQINSKINFPTNQIQLEQINSPTNQLANSQIKTNCL